MYSTLHNTVSAESSIRVDLIELYVPKFNFVAIIVHVCFTFRKKLQVSIELKLISDVLNIA
jgi:hypothetical protein